MQLNPNISTSQLESTTDSNGKTMLSSSNSEYIMAIRDLQSPMIPIQAYGLVTLQNLVLEKIKADKAGNTGKNGSNGSKDDASDDSIVETSIDVFKKLIEHEDSYIYLKSISALVRILTVSDKVHKKMILRQIADGYFTEEAAIDDENSNNDGFDARLRYGEVLIQFCKNVGSAHYFGIQGQLIKANRCIVAKGNLQMPKTGVKFHRYI
ncbi:hypothetical protein AX774_g1080 [Zancudomyces culisetae]|uniref:RNA polymerase II assembly factor Rtp1 C-terminal domain-containing protein n=1 Tax=Zancudomyces culisetae TaxID=1213189 RepID=A0A1R1PWU1_ZANCU|nr:hypothetical protein AX774_g1080 [Zancudomyces culisetae]|eukprot:OMH85372.1 hypothetical protein AX774_g1080 [Zancudomyces culisetae]